jgi:hypothetical protein
MKIPQICSVSTILFCAVLLAGGCKSTVANYDYGSLLPPALAAGAGTVAYTFTKDQSNTVKYGATAGAAGGTFLVSAIGRALILADMEKESAKGYVAGNTDTRHRLRNVRDTFSSAMEGNRSPTSHTFPMQVSSESAAEPIEIPFFQQGVP